MNLSGETKYEAVSEEVGTILNPYLTDFKNSLYYDIMLSNTQAGIPLSWEQTDLDGNVISTFAPAEWLWQRRNCTPFFDAEKGIIVHQVQVPDSEFALDYSPGTMVTCIIVMRINKDDFANSPYFLIDMDASSAGATPTPPFGNPDTNTIWNFLGIDEQKQKIYINYGGNTSNYTAVAVQYDESNVIDNLNLVSNTWGNLIGLSTPESYQASRMISPNVIDYDNEIVYVATWQPLLKIDFKNEIMLVEQFAFYPGTGVNAHTFLRDLGGYTLEHYDYFNQKIRILDSNLNQISESDFTFDGTPYILKNDPYIYTHTPLRTLVRQQSTKNLPLLSGDRKLSIVIDDDFSNVSFGGLGRNCIFDFERDRMYLYYNETTAGPDNTASLGGGIQPCILFVYELSTRTRLQKYVLDDMRIAKIGSVFHKPWFDNFTQKLYVAASITDADSGLTTIGGYITGLFCIDVTDGTYQYLGNIKGTILNEYETNTIYYYNENTNIVYGGVRYKFFKTDLNTNTFTEYTIPDSQGFGDYPMFFNPDTEVADVLLFNNTPNNNVTYVSFDFSDMTLISNSQAVDSSIIGNGFKHPVGTPELFQVATRIIYDFREVNILTLNRNLEVLNKVRSTASVGPNNVIQHLHKGEVHTFDFQFQDYVKYRINQVTKNLPLLKQPVSDPVLISDFNADNVEVSEGKVTTFYNQGEAKNAILYAGGLDGGFDYLAEDPLHNNHPTVKLDGQSIFTNIGLETPLYKTAISFSEFYDDNKSVWYLFLVANQSPNRRAGIYSNSTIGNTVHVSKQFNRIDLTNSAHNIVVSNLVGVFGQLTLAAVRLQKNQPFEAWVEGVANPSVSAGSVQLNNFGPYNEAFSFTYSNVKLGFVKIIGFNEVNMANEIVEINSIMNAAATKYAVGWTDITI